MTLCFMTNNCTTGRLGTLIPITKEQLKFFVMLFDRCWIEL